MLLPPSQATQNCFHPRNTWAGVGIDITSYLKASPTDLPASMLMLFNMQVQSKLGSCGSCDSGCGADERQ
jgi:hypothetical protein